LAFRSTLLKNLSLPKSMAATGLMTAQKTLTSELFHPHHGLGGNTRRKPKQKNKRDKEHRAEPRKSDSL
tara:strand:- start:15659 stop:15865 length:207 start_codon:yes stop_codon:yes gene_type:complete